MVSLDNPLLKLVPQGQLDLQQYRKWITGLQDSIKSGIPEDEWMDRKSCIRRDYRLEESLTPGIYIRELTMPAGQIVISEIHKQKHPFLITQGKVSVYDGHTMQLYDAPFKGITEPGTKRILYTHERTTWITFHPVEFTSLDEVDPVEVITCATFEEFDALAPKEDVEQGDLLCQS